MDLTTIAISGGAWLWEKYAPALTTKGTAALKDQWKKFQWTDAAEKYRLKVGKLYGTMQIMGMAQPIALDDIFTDVYMLDKPSAFARFGIEELKRLAAEPTALPPSTKRINGLRLVVEKGNLFILGKPGAGKTTFLKYIALKAAEGTIDKIPIFVSLKHWADSELDLIPFIIGRFDVCDFPEAKQFLNALLASGSAIVLFDGLDEVNEQTGQRDRQTRAINDFVEKYDQTQCLITCRIAATDYSFRPFRYIELADFNDTQIKTFVGNWFRDADGNQDQETSNAFLDEFEKRDNKGLRDLARTPLLLTLLCLAFNETLSFPQRRVEIYQEALDALLKKWDSSRRIKRDDIYRKLSLGHKENMLARIAAETFEKNEYFIAQRRLQDLISAYVRNVPPHETTESADAETILKSIEAQHGVFVERAHGIYSFSHLTIQEYLAAKYIVANAASRTLSKLIAHHSSDERWREVFLLTTSLLSDARDFVATFHDHIDGLVAGNERVIAPLLAADKLAARLPVSRFQGRAYYVWLMFYENTVEQSVRRTAFELVNSSSPDDEDWSKEIAIDRDLMYVLDELDKGGSDIADVIRLARTYSRQLGLQKLERALEGLSVPTDIASDVERDEFRRQIRNLMQERGIRCDWKLKRSEEKLLVQYLTATSMLQGCLDLAFMSPDEKRQVQNHLYLPQRASNRRK